MSTTVARPLTVEEKAKSECAKYGHNPFTGGSNATTICLRCKLILSQREGTQEIQKGVTYNGDSVPVKTGAAIAYPHPGRVARLGRPGNTN
jgi:hypothetical protein